MSTIERCRPSTTYEHELWSQGVCAVAGVDEVGRGSAVSAVVAAAVVLPVGCSGLDGVRDSKVVPRHDREYLALMIWARATAVALGAASVAEIERYNIRGATALAMQRALARIGPWQHAFLDGLPMKELPADRCTAIIDGDARCLSIACASIVAKVARDGLLAKLARRYAGYGWEHNAGYLTAEHRGALERLGPTIHHRRTFLHLPIGSNTPARPRGL